MESPEENATELVKNSALFKEFFAEREEILRHKWLESEKAGYDIGFERALLDWIVKHRSAWREGRQRAARAFEWRECKETTSPSLFPEAVLTR